MDGELAGKRAVVVGASSGIGRAIATEFDAEGAHVAVLSRSLETLTEMAAAAETEMVAIECDVSETASVDRAIERVLEEFGGIDIVINSAGIIARSPLTETSDDVLEQVVDVNLQGMMRVARASLPALIESEGTFIAVSSQLGEVGVKGAGVYCATKGGINNLTRQLAVEYAEEGVRVNTLAPGIVKTAMNEGVREEDEEWESRKEKAVPLGRLATPAEIAEPAVFLASDSSRYMTGHTLVVDGGYIAK